MLRFIIKLFGLGSNPGPELVTVKKYSGPKAKKHSPSKLKFNKAQDVKARAHYKRGIR